MSEAGTVLFSEPTLRYAKKHKVDVQALTDNVELRKQTVDGAFKELMSKILMHPPTVSDYDLPVKPELQSLGTTFVGRIVALLSTGETGVVVSKPDRKCIVRMDSNDEEIKVTWDELFWIKRSSGSQDAVNQIIKACCFVPQIQDLCIGTRVAVARLQWQTGRVIKLPESKKNCCFTIQLEHSRKSWKCKAEGLRLISDNSPVLGPLCSKKGRPKADWVRSEKKRRKPEMLIPASKSQEKWVSSIRPPKVLPPMRTAEEPLQSDSDEYSDDENSSYENEQNDDENRQTEFYL